MQPDTWLQYISTHDIFCSFSHQAQDMWKDNDEEDSPLHDWAHDHQLLLRSTLQHTTAKVLIYLSMPSLIVYFVCLNLFAGGLYNALIGCSCSGIPTFRPSNHTKVIN